MATAPSAWSTTSPSGVLIADATIRGFPVTYVSAGFEALTGYRAPEVVGRGCSFLQGPETDPGAVAVLTEALAAGGEAQATLLNYRADGTTFLNEVSVAPEHDARGRLVRYIGIQRDVTVTSTRGRRWNGSRSSTP